MVTEMRGLNEKSKVKSKVKKSQTKKKNRKDIIMKLQKITLFGIGSAICKTFDLSITTNKLTQWKYYLLP